MVPAFPLKTELGQGWFIQKFRMSVVLCVCLCICLSVPPSPRIPRESPNFDNSCSFIEWVSSFWSFSFSSSSFIFLLALVLLFTHIENLLVSSMRVFKASALWADDFYKSKMSVCPSVCLSVCSLLRYGLNVFLPPLPEVGCPKCLEIWNPWGKVMKEVVSHLTTFTYKGCKITTYIYIFFFGEFMPN